MVGSIGTGLLLFVGIEPSDTSGDVARAVDKVVNLRVFPDASGHMNRSLGEIDGSALVVSQFTLLADMRKGRRPSFTGSAPPEIAAPLIDDLASGLRRAGILTETGIFAASMEVELVNEGPVTLVLDIKDGRVT